MEAALLLLKHNAAVWQLYIMLIAANTMVSKELAAVVPQQAHQSCHCATGVLGSDPRVEQGRQHKP